MKTIELFLLNLIAKLFYSLRPIEKSVYRSEHFILRIDGKYWRRPKYQYEEIAKFVSLPFGYQLNWYVYNVYFKDDLGCYKKSVLDLLQSHNFRFEWFSIDDNGTISISPTNGLLQVVLYKKRARRIYIGTIEEAYYYLTELGITEFDSTGTCANIGKTASGDWYGWSHRARHKFKIGDTVKEGDCTASTGFIDGYTPLPGEDKSLPVGFVAKDSHDVKRMAIAFANSVS